EMRLPEPAKPEPPPIALTVPAGSGQVGQEILYEIKFTNQGQKPIQDIIVTAMFPPGPPPVKAEGPTGHRIEEQQVVFQPLSSLAPQAQAIYRFQARVLLGGPQRTRVRLTSPSWPEPLEAEGETQVVPVPAGGTKPAPAVPPAPPHS